MNNLFRCMLGVLAGFAAIGITSAGTSSPTAAAEWVLVRSVPNSFGGPMDLVVIQERRQRDRAFYAEIADAVCGARVACMVNFWTDRSQVPTSADMPVSSLQRMTAEYERHPSYKAPVLSLACWLYPSKEVAEAADCFYMPGAVMPWDREKK